MTSATGLMVVVLAVGAIANAQSATHQLASSIRAVDF